MLLPGGCRYEVYPGRTDPNLSYFSYFLGLCPTFFLLFGFCPTYPTFWDFSYVCPTFRRFFSTFPIFFFF